jgi:chromosome segregation ATPase
MNESNEKLSDLSDSIFNIQNKSLDSTAPVERITGADISTLDYELQKLNEQLTDLINSHSSLLVTLQLESNRSQVEKLYQATLNQFEKLKQRSHRVSRMSAYCNRAMEAQKSLIHLTTTIESGNGWTMLLSSLKENILDRFGRAVDSIVKRWEDQLITLEEECSWINQEVGHLPGSSDNAEAIQTLRESTQNYLLSAQHAFEVKKEVFFGLSQLIDHFLITVSDIEVKLMDSSV